MIPNKEKEECHYLAVKKHSTLLRRITSKHHGDFCSLNSFHSSVTDNKLKSHRNQTYFISWKRSYEKFCKSLT